MIENSQFKVLLIEDHPGDAKLVEIYLREYDYGDFNLTNVDTFKDGILKLQESSYDTVLLDLSLPDSHGFSTLTKMLEMFPDLSVIVLTGTDNEELGIQAVKSGAQDFLVKGKIDTFSLTKSIRYAVERNNMQRQVAGFEKDLNVSEQRLLEAQQIAKIGNYELDLNTKEMNWSKEMYRIFNIQSYVKDVNLDLYLKHIHPKDLDFVKENFANANKEAWSFAFEHAIIINDNEVVYVRNRGNVRTNANQELVMIGTIQDITETKEAELAVAKSETKYRTIVANSKDAIYGSAMEGELIEYNDSLIELLGYTREELNSLNVENFYHNIDDRKQIIDQIFEFGFVKEFELKLVKKNKELLDCSITSSLWENDNGEVIGFHGIVRDITELKKTEQLLKDKEIAEKSAKMKEMFLANMSHEIRTPLNVVVGMANLLYDTSPSAKQLEYINGIVSSSENLLKIINDILDFSKIEAGKLEIDDREFFLKKLIEDLVTTHKYKANEKKLKLYISYDTEIPDKVIGDPVRLNQVLLNIVSNSIKYTDAGEVHLKVNLVSEDANSIRVEFIIQDTGIGISKENLALVFESFTQVSMDSKRKVGGTGLGLTIVKQLVDLMNGEIKVESEIDKGTQFSIQFTFEKNTLQDSNGFTKMESVQVSDIGNAKILLVEDHKLNQIVTTNILKKTWSRISIDIADNGRIAVEKLKENDYDLILMDLQMPEMDGYEATIYIRNEIEGPKSKIPIIAITAHALKQETKRCFDVGMNDFLTKPINVNTLLSKVNAIFSNNDLSIGVDKPSEFVNGEKGASNKTGDEVQEQIINLDYLDTLAGGDEELKIQMINQIVTDLPDEIENLKTSGKSSDWSQVAAIAHKMKSTVAYLGTKHLGNEVVEIIMRARENRDLDTINDKIESLANELMIAHSQLRKELSILT